MGRLSKDRERRTTLRIREREKENKREGKKRECEGKRLFRVQERRHCKRDRDKQIEKQRLKLETINEKVRDRECLSER